MMAAITTGTGLGMSGRGRWARGRGGVFGPVLLWGWVKCWVCGAGGAWLTGGWAGCWWAVLVYPVAGAVPPVGGPGGVYRPVAPEACGPEWAGACGPEWAGREGPQVARGAGGRGGRGPAGRRGGAGRGRGAGGGGAGRGLGEGAGGTGGARRRWGVEHRRWHGPWWGFAWGCRRFPPPTVTPGVPWGRV